MNMNVKDELLKRLFEAEGKPISGQEFADEFGLSRTAIWKYIKEFEEDGYKIGFESGKRDIYCYLPRIL